MVYPGYEALRSRGVGWGGGTITHCLHGGIPPPLSPFTVAAPRPRDPGKHAAALHPRDTVTPLPMPYVRIAERASRMRNGHVSAHAITRGGFQLVVFVN